jgi:hypothetical protein
MISKDKTSGKKPKGVTAIVRLISDQRQMLAHSGCDRGIIERFDELLHFLRSATAEELDRVFPKVEKQRPRSPEELSLSDETIEAMPTSDLMQIVDQETTTRKTLERIAIHRFRVPRGSMSSFSNRVTLTEKLRTLVRNEQAHTAIEALARGHGEPETRKDVQELGSEKKD